MKHDSAPPVCPPEHAHGKTSTCYGTHGCRCRNCQDGRATTTAAWRKLKAYGRFESPYIDPQPAREHVAHLRAFGMGARRIAEVAGVSPNVIQTLVYGRKDRPGEPVRQITRRNAAKILAVRAELQNLRPQALVSARGTQRRFQALVARGWTLRAVAARMGTAEKYLRFMSSPQCTLATHLAAAAVYEELWDQEPPRATQHERTSYGRSLTMARRRRWLPPLAWDDIDNDPEPPVVEPTPGAIDEMAVELACAGEQVRLTQAERRAALAILHARRWSDRRIATALGIAPETALRIRQELSLPAFHQNDLVRAEAAA